MRAQTPVVIGAMHALVFSMGTRPVSTAFAVSIVIRGITSAGVNV